MWRTGIVWITLLLCLPLVARAQEMRIIVPAYFHPGGATLKYWEQMNTAAHKVPLWVIINPADGPGKQTEPESAAAFKALRAAGGRTLGYVDTDYCKRSQVDVLKDIDLWLSLYPGQTDGFFLDEMTNDDSTEHLDYLAHVYAYIKSKNPAFLVMGNPGTNTLEVYLKRPVCDALMTFESAASEYPAYQPDAWTTNYRPDQFAHILHTAPPTEAFLLDAIKTAQARRAGWIFITDAIFDKTHRNPYNRLPRYWDKEVAEVRKRARSKTPPQPSPS